MTSEPRFPAAPNGRVPLFPPGLVGELREPDRSSYVEYLPGVFHRNEFLGRFLLIFENILRPMDRQIANLPAYFDPDTTTEELLDWLGEWVEIVFDDRVPVERRRVVVNNAVRIYRKRGTSAGLAEFIEAVTGVMPEVEQPTLAEVSGNPALAFTFTVRMTVTEDSPVEEDLVRRLIEAQKPAFAAGELVFEREGRARASSAAS